MESKRERLGYIKVKGLQANKGQQDESGSDDESKLEQPRPKTDMIRPRMVFGKTIEDYLRMGIPEYPLEGIAARHPDEVLVT